MIGAQARLPVPLETSLFLAEKWLVKVASAENPEADLRNLRAVLLNLLEIVEEDSRINSAVDDLYAAAVLYEADIRRAATHPSERQYRLVLKRAARIELALAALRRALASAKPSALGRVQGLLW